jgi:hypothetical protein
MRENMREFITTILTIIGIIVLAPVSFSQQTIAYKPDGWQGLTLDQSTPDDAVRILGQPVSDKLDRLQIYNIDVWVSPRHKEKIFRVLTYKNIGDVKLAALAFLDNRLVRIHTKYADNKFPAKDLRERFGIDFVLVKGEVPSNSTPSMYEGRKENPVSKGYPAAYYMVGVTQQSLISAFVARGGIKGVLEIANGVKKKEPGSLMHLDIISRTLAKGRT